jgi:molybdopterin-binding protein
MKLSTRNIIKGKVVDVQEGKVVAKVKVDIGAGNVISSTVTVEAVKELDIKMGDNICVLIKASSVMLGKE